MRRRSGLLVKTSKGTYHSESFKNKVILLDLFSWFMWFLACGRERHIKMGISPNFIKIYFIHYNFKVLVLHITTSPMRGAIESVVMRK